MSRRKNSNTIMKRFGIGICSGVIGGALAFGIINGYFMVCWCI